VQYIAQVLKRNRTLKVLNMSDNRIDSAGLAVLAEALVRACLCGATFGEI
jgi:ABC-type transporter Mla MlaB component